MAGPGSTIRDFAFERPGEPENDPWRTAVIGLYWSLFRDQRPDDLQVHHR